MRANIFPACIQYLFDYNIISTIKWCIFTKPWGSIFRNKGPDPLKDINATFRLPSASMSSCKRKLWLIHNRTYESKKKIRKILSLYSTDKHFCNLFLELLLIPVKSTKFQKHIHDCMDRYTKESFYNMFP